MAEFKLTAGDQTYTFTTEMVDVSALKHIKQWYGKELGRYNNFIEAFFEGDPDAALCAVWIARRAAGETNIPEPHQMTGFTLAQWIGVGGVEGNDEEETPTGGDTSPQTPTSTPTPTSSGGEPAGPSRTSSDGSRNRSKASAGSSS